MRYLPNKKFAFFIIFTLLVFGGGFMIFKKWPDSAKKPLVPVNIRVSGINELSPSPGADSGPGDLDAFLAKTASSSAPDQTAGASEEPETLTSALGKQLFNDFWNVKQGAGPEQISQPDQDNILNSFMSGVDNFSQTEAAIIYAKSDLKISKNSGVADIKNFGNEFGLIIKKYFGPLPETEMTIFQRALTNEDDAEFQKLGPVSDAYRNTAHDALSLAVPDNISDTYLAIINGFTGMAREIDAMKNTPQDAVRSLLGLKKYQADIATTYGALKNLNAYFLSRGIIFSDEEPGAIFRVYSQ